MMVKEVMRMGSLPTVVKVTKRGFFDFRHIDGLTYEQTREEFRREGLELPRWKTLKRFGKRADMRLLLSDLDIEIKFATGSGYRYAFKRGYLTDLASVPSYFRSVVDNDDIDVIAAALVHDRNFSVHHLSFEQTNELFYKMYVARKGVPGSDDKWLDLPKRARIAWFAVRSVVGRYLWRKLGRRREAWAMTTSSHTKLRYVEK